jgi:spore germination protein
MPDLSLAQTFRPSKTRRYVTAWTLRGDAEKSLETARQYQDTFDQIIFMCGGVKPDLTLRDDWPIAERKALAARYRELGISTMNDYGGGWDFGQALMADPKVGDAWIDRMIEEAEATGGDGVDIDFEHWPSQGQFAFNSFIEKLADALHRRNKMLTVCIGAISPEARRETTMGFIDAPLIGRHADWVRPMTYDLYCPPSPVVGPTSTANWGRDTMSYLATQVPRHKIIMGLPTYSVDWDTVDPGKSMQVYDSEWIAQREKESTCGLKGRVWCYYWDVNLIRWSDKDGHPHLLWVSDAKSTKSHLLTVDSLDLGGVCFWCLHQKPDPKIWECVREHFKRW